jgi:hypothetical protein
MHPFGISPVCPRCSKLVYAAEQVMGPGRKLYHKPCLTCTSCNKRLDSHSLVEHDEDPYCKICHVKHFGTRHLRHANLPQAPPPVSDPVAHRVGSTSPITENAAKLDETPDSAASVRAATVLPTGNLLKPNTPLSPTRTVFSMRPTSTGELATKPLTRTATGTRYGNVLGNGDNLTNSPSPKKWGSVNPACPRCNKSVYFAEQVRAIGRSWHKSCLRCIECGSTLASGQVTDNDGDPFCSKCYGKVHGPRGAGYALLGKAGG